MNIVRPSLLPKLEECPCYKNKAGDPGEAAKRGTKLDAIIRLALERPDHSIAKAAGALKESLNDEDEAACYWAVRKVIQLAEGEIIVTKETELRADAGIENLACGTMDTLIPAKGILIDYKSGSIRSYKAQMAAYALYCMNAYFCESWTAVLLFIDQREATYLTFTRPEAELLVTSIINAEKTPRICEYCSWCDDCDTCPLRMQMVTQAQNQVEEQGLKKLTKEQIENPATAGTMVAKLIANPDMAAEWCEKASVIASIDSAVKNGIKERMKAEGISELGRFKLSKPGVSRVVPETLVGHYIGEFGHARVLHAYGNMSTKKFEELWRLQFGERPAPEDRYMEVPTAQRLTIGKKKK